MNPPRHEWSLDTCRLGRRVLVFERLDSTNNLAATLAGDPANDGLAILAEEQTAGRGQHGRTWLAPPGQSVLLSLLLTPPPPLCRPAVLTAWAAVAVCATVYQTIGQPTRIKWPNDVLLHDRKVCGILIESANPQPERAARSFVVGIGLNVQQSAATFAAAGLPDATALAQFAAYPLDTHRVAADLIRQLDRDYETLCRGDFETVARRWKDHLGLLGKHVLAECRGVSHRGRLIELSFHSVKLARAGQPPLVLVPEQILHLHESVVD